MSHSTIWTLVERQHGVISRAQLLSFGFTRAAINHRLRIGRLHPAFAGVYAVGRPELSRRGCFMAAVLSCGEGAALSHASAAELWQIAPRRPGNIHVSVATDRRGPDGITTHRRKAVRTTCRHGIPVTTPTETIVDLATCITGDALIAAVNEADKRDLVHVEALRMQLDATPSRPGVAVLARLIDRETLVLTDTQLERLFVPIAKRAGLPKPLTQQWINGARVDFYFPDQKLVVETDGNRFHRTPFQQTKDLRRDHAHFMSGLIPLRFSHGQVKYEPAEVEKVLRSVL
jgi:very-short-patch-repair endonuclease